MSLSFALDDMTIQRVVELDAPFLPALEMLPALTPELLESNRHWLQPDSLDDNDVFKLCYQAYLVRTPHHTILIDSCLGNDKPRARPEWSMKTDPAFMRALAAADVGVQDIDFVLCTHLHGDHVGWNTRLDNGAWVPTFPRARYVFHKQELAATESLHRSMPNPTYEDSVLPIVRAGRADVVDDAFALGDHVRLLPTPGHTDGHIAVCVGKKQDLAVVTGDLIHVPLQMRYPELSFARDKDPVLAASTRRSFLERFCDTNTLCCTSHFPSPSAGRIQRWGDGYRLKYQD